jgi:hypothetical protein
MTLRKNHQRVPKTPKKTNPDNGRLRVANIASPENGRSIMNIGNHTHDPAYEVEPACSAEMQKRKWSAGSTNTRWLRRIRISCIISF